MPAVLRGDPGRLRQILINLVGNAVKFTERGEVVVRVTRVGSDGGHGARSASRSRDTGIGIAPEARARLFQSFSQADSSTTRQYGGTGLGLAISKQLAELMGGDIGVESELGRGQHVLVHGAAGEAAATGAAARPAVRADLRGLRVLVVDDNGTNRAILRQQLAALGHASDEVAERRRRRWSACARPPARRPFDLVILDYQMPEMDGLEVAQAIRAEPALAALPLVLLTSVGHDEHAAAAREVGIAAYLTKPVRQSQLYDCLASVMGDTVSPRAAPPRAPAPPGRDPPARRAPRPPRARRGCWSWRTTSSTRRWPSTCWRRAATAWTSPAMAREALEALARTDYALGAHGLPDARARRLRGHGRDPRARARGATIADRRHDGRRDGRASGRSVWPPGWTTTSPSRSPARPRSRAGPLAAGQSGRRRSVRQPRPRREARTGPTRAANR